MPRLPPPKKVIRGAKVEGTYFYLPQNHKKEELEGSPEGHPGKIKNLENVLLDAEKKGYRQGLQDGHEQGYEAGKNEGLDVGYNLGVGSAEAKIKEPLKLLNTIAKTFATRQEEMFDLAKPELIKFSLIVCENLIRNTLSQPDAFATQISYLLNQAKELLKDASINVFLAEEDLKMLESHIKNLSKNEEEFKKLKFLTDNNLERGNCRIESNLGLLNFDIKRLLEDIERKALEASSNSPKELK